MQPEVKRSELRRRVYEVVEADRSDEPASRAFDAFIVTLIILNTAAFVAETVPSVQARFGAWLSAFEVFSVAVFTIEYGLRIWTAVEVPFLARLTPAKARLRFAARPYQVIDLLAILPFYLAHLLPVDLRALRILRLLKFSRYSPAMHTLIRVLQNERRALAGAGLLLMMVLLFASTGIYFIEREAQPDKFGSVPDSAWWAMATLTTVGYGDVAPVTAWGRLFGGVVMVVGLCVLALPVAIIATGFSQEVSRRDFVISWSLMSRIPLLAELDAAQVAEIMPLFQARNVAAGTEVIAADAPSDAMFFIASGQVELRSAGGTARFGVGDFFGEWAMVEGGPPPGSVHALTKCRLLKLFRNDFRHLSAASPAVAAHILKIAAERRGGG
jgi:voltage-gated potassium channel